MREIGRIDSSPKQTITFILEDKSKVKFNFFYLPTQQAWFVDVEYGDFSVYGLRVFVSPNMLDRYSNIIEFGLNIETYDGLDPWQLDDFESQRAIASVINEEEVRIVREYLSGKR